MSRAGPRAWIVGACVALALGARAARAQDFAVAAPPFPAASPESMLERGLPSNERSWSAAAGAVSWLGVAGLTTQWVAAAAAAGPARLAAGVSRTAAGELGWSAAGLAAGAVTARGGAAVRIVARRDDAVHADGSASAGGEAGGGAWMRAGARARLWAVAPQLATTGEPPPLARALALGVAWQIAGAQVWLERAAPVRTADPTGTHAAGVLLDLGAAQVWAEARERPVRAALGLAARIRAFEVATRVETHPRLGDTVALALRCGGGTSRARP